MSHRAIGVKVNSSNGGIHHDDQQRKDEIAHRIAGFVSPEQCGNPSRGRSEIAIGSALTENDCAALEGRWIDRQLAMHAKLRRVDSLTGAEMVGKKGGNYAGILIPCFHPHSGLVRDYRPRRDQPDVEYDSNISRQILRFGSPTGTVLDLKNGKLPHYRLRWPSGTSFELEKPTILGTRAASMKIRRSGVVWGCCPMRDPQNEPVLRWPRTRDMLAAADVAPFRNAPV